MHTVALVLVLASALAHATWNAILKRSRDPEDAGIAMLVLSGIASVGVAVAVGGPLPSRSAVLWSLLSGGFEAAYFATLARALARAPLGSVYTVVRGGALVLVWPISVLALGEHPTRFSVAGTLAVLLGLVAVGASQRPATPAAEEGGPARGGTGIAAAGAAASARSGLLVAAASAVFVAGYHVADKIALSHGGSPSAVNAISLATGAALNLVRRGRGSARAVAALRAQPGACVSAALLAGGSFLLFLMAMRQSGAGVVMTLRNTSILFAQVLAFAMGEPLRRLAVVGAVLVTAGAVLLAL